MAGNGIELVWEGKRREIERVALPFQRVEVINESRATRQAGPLFAAGAGLPPEPLFDARGNAEQPWRNKLIWGDNKYVLASLLEGDPSIGLESLAGKVDLIYIDPPFATKQDFSIQASIGDLGIEKSASAVEEVAYRDTWGRGLSSYLQMMYERLTLLKGLLTEAGSVFVHVGTAVSHLVRAMCDELFGVYQNEIAWQRTDPHNDATKRFGVIHDTIMWFSPRGTPLYNYDDAREELSPAAESEFSLLELQSGDVVNYKGNELRPGRRFKVENATYKGSNPTKRFVWRGALPPVKREWILTYEGMETALAEKRLYLRDAEKGSTRCLKKYLDENQGILLQDIWTNAGRMKGGSDYPTQKPTVLLERIIRAGAPTRGIVLDAFAGSGSTMVAAETLGRRWIGCDLGRFAIHTSRKRLLGIDGCKPFEVLNLGRYERRYWQGINAGEKVYEYFKFIVELYHAEPVVGFTHLHGRKGAAMVHVGATDAPVTIAEVRAAMDECKANGFTSLDILGWEWEMGLNSTGLQDLQRASGVEARLFHIPHETMDKRAVAAGDVHFYEAAYVATKVHTEGKQIRIELTDFLVAIDDYIREKVGDKVKKWSDWIDYWAVDFGYDGDVFHNQWQAYRTRKEPRLELISGLSRPYETPGAHNVLVKVVDIFGNDTTALIEVTV